MRLHHVQTVTLICQDLTAMIAAYCDGLGQTLQSRSNVTRARALALGCAELGEQRCAWVATDQASAPWLELIEVPQAPQSGAFARFGWLAVELLVRDVDALATRLAPHFKILGAPKDLDMSDAIRAMQVSGPAGEVLYLTQVKRALAAFQIPLSASLTQAVGAPFVAVLGCRNRTEAAAFYLGLGGKSALSFQARLSAFDATHAQPAGKTYPMATVQCTGDALLELDQIDLPLQAALASPLEGTGIFSVTLTRLGTRAQAGPTRLLRGPMGECIELC
jgi:catechol 2,3-dioxygenase-like lactoylglutathione lyase family enzyme